ncbi:MAG: ATP-binding cassette domain-containing protein [Bacillota bacterium]|nr:ATP-binding cassette domain-containing protein [Bacillota bacterium]
MSRAMVEVEELRKEFPRRGKSRQDPPVVAVAGVSFEIPQGEIFGLLGPNGAGKTTTIKMISTLLKPTSGSVRVAGKDAIRYPIQALRHLGTVLSGERSIYWKLTGRENLEYFAALYGLPARVARQRINALLDRFALTKRADENVERYSTGMRQRICLAKALLAEPDVLMLDEPTAGLDPQSARNLRDLIREVKSEGRTVLLTTHYMEEADQLCDRVAIFDHGQIIALNSPGALKHDLDDLNVLEADIARWDDAWGAALQERGAVNYDLRFDETARVHRLTVHLNGHLTTGEAVTELVNLGADIRQFSLKSPSLEDVFIRLTGKSLRE